MPYVYGYKDPRRKAGVPYEARLRRCLLTQYVIIIPSLRPGAYGVGLRPSAYDVGLTMTVLRPSLLTICP